MGLLKRWALKTLRVYRGPVEGLLGHDRVSLKYKMRSARAYLGIGVPCISFFGSSNIKVPELQHKMRCVLVDALPLSEGSFET